jgi:hypothetical protein
MWFHRPLRLPCFSAFILAFKYVPTKQGLPPKLMELRQ